MPLATGETKMLKIMPLGDSITAGYFVGKGGYRDILRLELTAKGLEAEFVGRNTDQSDGIPEPAHEGYSGYTIRMIADKAAEALDLFNPDVILLFAGTNDVRVNGANDQPEHPDCWKTAQMRLDNLIQLLINKAPNATVFVGALLPFAKAWGERESAAKEFNGQLAEIVAARSRRGEKVHFVDFRQTVTTEDLADGLHPNAVGYGKIATAWTDAVVQDYAY